MPTEPRRVRADDAGRAAEILNAYSRRLFGEGEVTAEEVAHWWEDPHVDAWLADGAYADLQREGDTRFWVDLRGAADEALLAAVEAHVRGLAAPGAFLRVVVPSEDPALGGLLERAGFRPIRSSFRMRIELGEEEPAEPAWPEGVAARRGSAGDARAAYDAYVEAFADHWEFHAEPFEEWRRWNVEGPGLDPTLWTLAEDGAETAGVAIARPHHSGAPDAGHVSILAVRRPWRGRGLGLALLQAAFRELHRRGRPVVDLGVDAENTTGAVRLYERAGMHVSRRSDTLEKRL